MSGVVTLRELPTRPRVTVVIPSRDGDRDGCVNRLVGTIEKQSFQDFETLMVVGVSPQGKAINMAAAMARGDILLILDDDSWIAGDDVFQRLVDTLDSDSAIGMAGASIVVPPEASSFERRAAPEFPRFNTPIVRTITDSDFACHGCCAIPLRVFREVGGEREDIIRGLDPDLRVRLRSAGYRVVLAPDAAIYHPLPDTFRKLLRTFFRNGFGSAYAWKFQPESVYETAETLDEAGFRPRRSFAYRVVRFPVRLAVALATGRVLRFSAYCAYAAGYLWGLISAKREAVHAGA